jgi:hypothetical protein
MLALDLLKYWYCFSGILGYFLILLHALVVTSLHTVLCCTVPTKVPVHVGLLYYCIATEVESP